jgi:hypothetical protein
MKTAFLRTAICSLSVLCSIALTCNKQVNGPEGNNPVNSSTIGTSGGTVSLDSTAAITVPPGAVSRNAAITIVKLPSSQAFYDTSIKRIVLSCSTTVAFSKPVTISVPLPAGVAKADSLAFSVGYFDSTKSFVDMPFSLHDSAGKTFVDVHTTHFSIWGFSFCDTPPDQAMLEVPYYNQGSTGYCWATSLNMICEAAEHVDVEEIFSIVGATGIDDSGVLALTLRYNSTIDGLVRVRTGVAPERRILHTLELGNYRIATALRSEIALGHPVELFPTSINHAFVIVGFDKDSFYVNNPNQVGNPICYRGMTYDQIVSDMGYFDQFVMVSIPKALDPDRPLVSINLPHGGPRSSLHFIRRKGTASQTSSFQWTGRRPEGYSFLAGNTLSDTVTDADSMYVRGIEVANAQNSDAPVTVVYDLLDGSGKSLLSDRTSLTIPRHGLSMVNFPGQAVSAFRDSTVTFANYRFSIRVLANGTSTDAVTVNVPMQWRPSLYLTSLTPASGAPGSSVVIKGAGFGAVQDQSIVTCGTTSTEVIAWSDTAISIKVPATASGTVNVKVTVNTKASNTLPLTVNVNFLIRLLSPETGSTGSSVYIFGKGFGNSRGSSIVTFTNDTVDVYRSWNDSTIEVYVPNNAGSGPVNVVVNNSVSNGVVFRLKAVLGYIRPTSSPVPATIELHGLNFGASQDSSAVLMNNKKVAVRSWSDTLILVVADTTFDTSTVNIQVQTGTLKSAVQVFSSRGKRFIATLAPDSGIAGNQVLIHGQNFLVDTARGSVLFQPGIPAKVVSVNNTDILVEVPVGVKDGPVKYVLASGDTLYGPSFDVIDTLNILQRCNHLAISVYGNLLFTDSIRHVDTLVPSGFTMSNATGTDTVIAPLVWIGQSFSANGKKPEYNGSGYDTTNLTISGSVSNDYQKLNLSILSQLVVNGYTRWYSKLEVQNLPITDLQIFPHITYEAKGTDAGNYVQSIGRYLVLGQYGYFLKSATYGTTGLINIQFDKRPQR